MLVRIVEKHNQSRTIHRDLRCAATAGQLTEGVVMGLLTSSPAGSITQVDPYEMKLID